MKEFDVLVIGGGVVGSAIARELSKYRVTIGVLEKNPDIINETSGRNSAVIHGGFAYDTGSLKARLCLQGNRGMTKLSEDLDFTFLRCGKVLVGQTEEEYASLERTLAQGKRNGVDTLELIDEKRLHELVPMAVGKFAMFSKDSGIVDPFGYTVALAENAVQNGARYFLRTEVTGIRREGDTWAISTNRGEYKAKWVVNAAGLCCGKISDMLGIKGYKVIGSKGDYIILDKRTGPLLPMPVYPVPSNTYMGIHVTNTVDGNVIIGPNAETVEDFTYYGVPQRNMDYLAKSASDIWPCIRKEDMIRNYSGILPKWVDEQGVIQDFKIEVKEELAPNALNLVGIESPGLTAAVPIAEYAVALMQEHGFAPEKNEDFDPVRKGIRRFDKLSDEEREELVKQDPDYGELICRCEKVTKAEILQAIRNPLGVNTMTGIKYRTRAMMGRCQGGYCQMRIEKLLEEELSLKPEEILYEREGSWVLQGELR